MQRVFSFAAFVLPLLATSAASADDAVDSYRSFSFGLTSGMDLMGGVASVGPGISGLRHMPALGRATGLVGINVSPRLMIAGFQLGAQFGVYFNEGIDTIMVPGANLGYAIGLVGPLALTPSVRTLFLIPTAMRTSASMQLTGELGLEWFFGKNGYMEPYFATGVLHDTGANQASFILGGGYRIGVTFF